MRSSEAPSGGWAQRSGLVLWNKFLIIVLKKVICFPYRARPHTRGESGALACSCVCVRGQAAWQIRTWRAVWCGAWPFGLQGTPQNGRPKSGRAHALSLARDIQPVFQKGMCPVAPTRTPAHPPLSCTRPQRTWLRVFFYFNNTQHSTQTALLPDSILIGRGGPHREDNGGAHAHAHLQLLASASDSVSDEWAGLGACPRGWWVTHLWALRRL
jgi:hypothetical protein